MDKLRLGLRRLYKIIIRTIQEWREDHADRLAAAVSFYTIFSAVPSLIIVIGLTGLVVDQSRVEAQVLLQIQRTMGSDAADFVGQVLQSRKEVSSEGNRFATGLGVATALFGASGAFAHLQGALNTIWQVRAKPKQGLMNFVRTRLFSFVILLLIGFMLMVSLVINVWLVLINGWFKNVMPDLHLLFNVGNGIVSFGIGMLLFALLFKVMPDVTIRWHDIWVGAAVTSLLFNLGKWAIGLYLGSSTLARTFGAAGAVVVLLIWIFFSVQVVLIGAEFIKVFATQRGRAVLPAAHAINVKWTPEDASLVD
jgi:membrane protein